MALNINAVAIPGAGETCCWRGRPTDIESFRSREHPHPRNIAARSNPACLPVVHWWVASGRTGPNIGRALTLSRWGDFTRVSHSTSRPLIRAASARDFSRSGFRPIRLFSSCGSFCRSYRASSDGRVRCPAAQEFPAPIEHHEAGHGLAVPLRNHHPPRPVSLPSMKGRRLLPSEACFAWPQ